LESIYFIDSNIGYATGQYAILKTIDGGANWASIETGITDWFTSVFCVNADTGYVCGGSKILKTINGGVDWAIYVCGTLRPIYSIYFVDAKIGYIGGVGGIFKTKDGGETWFDVSEGSFPYSIFSLCFPDSLTGYAVAALGKIVKTTNGGGSLSINETLKHEFKFTIYPNPANTNITISNDNATFQGPIAIRIYGVRGELLIFEEFKDNNQMELKLDNLRSGIYIVQIQSKSWVETQKLIIQ
jgi:photosystem II stability/assembly factor-like uncharacterized protein